jgi:hypothetical protein
VDERCWRFFGFFSEIKDLIGKLIAESLLLSPSRKAPVAEGIFGRAAEGDVATF